MGLILWGFFFAMLMLGIEGACWLYGTAIAVGFVIGIYMRIKKGRLYLYLNIFFLKENELENLEL